MEERLSPKQKVQGSIPCGCAIFKGGYMSTADDMIDSYLDRLLDSPLDPKPKRKKGKKPYHRWSKVRKEKSLAKKAEVKEDGDSGT